MEPFDRISTEEWEELLIVFATETCGFNTIGTIKISEELFSLSWLTEIMPQAIGLDVFFFARYKYICGMLLEILS